MVVPFAVLLQHELYVASHEQFLQQMQEYEEMAWEDHRSTMLGVLQRKETEWEEKFATIREQEETRARRAIEEVVFPPPPLSFRFVLHFLLTGSLSWCLDPGRLKDVLEMRLPPWRSA